MGKGLISLGVSGEMFLRERKLLESTGMSWVGGKRLWGVAELYPRGERYSWAIVHQISRAGIAEGRFADKHLLIVNISFQKNKSFCI